MPSSVSHTFQRKSVFTLVSALTADEPRGSGRLILEDLAADVFVGLSGILAKGHPVR